MVSTKEREQVSGSFFVDIVSLAAPFKGKYSCENSWLPKFSISNLDKKIPVLPRDEYLSESIYQLVERFGM